MHSSGGFAHGLPRNGCLGRLQRCALCLGEHIFKEVAGLAIMVGVELWSVSVVSREKCQPPGSTGGGHRARVCRRVGLRRHAMGMCIMFLHPS
jgi:hypothetical protein